MAGGRVHHCNTCLGKRKSEYRSKNVEFYRSLNREWWEQLRRDVITGYGGKCACCGESTPEFLSLDHVIPIGSKARKATGGTQGAYADARRRNYPLDYQLLCHNCNQAKGYYGYCPHQLNPGEPRPKLSFYRNGRPRNDSTKSGISEIPEGITGPSEVIQQSECLSYSDGS